MIYLPPILIAVILGLVEGATEFLPVSSTGHLIAVGAMLNFTGDRAATFEVVIQIGAIFAVIWHYRRSLIEMALGFFKPGIERSIVLNLLIAFLPAAVIGLILHGWIKDVLFSPVVVAWALVIGGFIMLLIERFAPASTAGAVAEVRPRQALVVGLAQVVSMIPGTSRAAATILGGYAAGLSRPAATEFSFLLAIPTIIGAAGLDLFKSRDLLGADDLMLFAVGIIVSFISALAVIRGFLRFVERHSFAAFAWYRIAFGCFLGLLFWLRVI